MICKLYVMFDKVAHLFGEPFTAQKDELAIRRFNYIASQSPMVSADLQLFCLGSYDMEQGKIEPCCDFICNYEVIENA